MEPPKPPAIDPATVPVREGSNYPKPLRGAVEKRQKQALGDAVGLTHYGVNLVRLPPETWSSQRHWHRNEDEFIYVLEGEVTLVTDGGEQVLQPGSAAGFPAGKADGHHLVNRSSSDVVYLEVGDRAGEEDVAYPDVDLKLTRRNGPRVFTRRDGEPYPAED
jgi:uncharacterized cupin superfamily protein